MLHFNSWGALCAAVILMDQSLLSLAAMKQDSEILASFGQPIQLFGDMIENNIDFVDGLNVDVYAPTNRTFTVAMNNNPMTGRFVTGTTGQQFVSLLGYSYVIQSNTNASDLIARIEMPYDPTKLALVGIDPSNTFIGKMASDGKSWQVVNSARNVNKAAFKARIEKMSSIDGEYRLLGRLGAETENVFNEYGSGPEDAVQIVGGGRQDVEFIDGLRFSILSDQNLTMNVNFFSPIPPSLVPTGMTSLYAFGYTINTTQGFNVLPPGSPPSAPPAAPSLVPSGAIPVPPALASSSVPNAVPSQTGMSPPAPIKSSTPLPASGAGAGSGPKKLPPRPSGSAPGPKGVSSPPSGGYGSGAIGGGSSPSWGGSGSPFGGQNGGQSVPISPKSGGGAPSGPWGNSPPSGGNSPSWGGGYGGQAWRRFVRRQAAPAATIQVNGTAATQPAPTASLIPVSVQSGQSAASAAPVPAPNPSSAQPSQSLASPVPSVGLVSSASPLPTFSFVSSAAPLPTLSLVSSVSVVTASPIPSPPGAPLSSASLGTLLPPVATGTAAPISPSSPAPPLSATPGPPPPGFVQELTVEIPLNLDMLFSIMGSSGATNAGLNNAQSQPASALGESTADTTDDLLRTIRFQLARRDVGAATQPFAPFPGPGGPNAAANAVATGLSVVNGKLLLTGAQQLDGEYVILVPVGMQADGQPVKKGSSGGAGRIGAGSRGWIAGLGAVFVGLML